MRNFFLGFVSALSLATIGLSLVTIPTVIVEVECQKEREQTLPPKSRPLST